MQSFCWVLDKSLYNVVYCAAFYRHCLNAASDFTLRVLMVAGFVMIVLGATVRNLNMAKTSSGYSASPTLIFGS